jgi:hypothetical protein
MRTLLAALVVGLCGSLWAGESVTTLTATNTFVVLGSPISRAAMLLLSPRTNAQVYAQGQVLSIGGYPMVATVAGTGTNAVLACTGGDVVDKTVRLRQVLTAPRRSLVLSNTGTNSVLYRFSSGTLSATTGVVLPAQATHTYDSAAGCPQGPVYARSVGGTTLYVVENW